MRRDAPVSPGIGDLLRAIGRWLLAATQRAGRLGMCFPRFREPLSLIADGAAAQPLNQ